MKKALITGVNGQDGAYLSEFLIKKGYEVHGLRRRSSTFNTSRIDHLINNPTINNKSLFLYYADLTDSLSISKLFQEHNFDEVYNLAAQSHVGVSFNQPEYTCNVDGLGALRLLEIIKSSRNPKTKFYQASTSELYGGIYNEAQTEKTPFYPKSPYAVGKLMAYWITVNYRESFDMFACNGILFNHESPLRGETFVTRKITQALSKIVCGIQEELILGNLDAKRDWGHAKEYTELMWLILQHHEPIDFVAATNKQYSIREFVELCCKEIGVIIRWEGEGLNEIGVVEDYNHIVNDVSPTLKKGKILVRVSEEYFRPSEVNTLLGDASLAKELLGWEPKIGIEELACEMITSDLTDAVAKYRLQHL